MKKFFRVILEKSNINSIFYHLILYNPGLRFFRKKRRVISEILWYTTYKHGTNTLIHNISMLQVKNHENPLIGFGEKLVTNY